MLFGIKNYFKSKRTLGIFCSVFALVLGIYALVFGSVWSSIWFFAVCLSTTIVTIVYFTKNKYSTFCKIGLFLCSLSGGVGCAVTLWLSHELNILLTMPFWWIHFVGVAFFVALMGVSIWLDGSLDVF